MNSITITRLYDQLSSKLGKETAENLITFIEQKVGEEMENNEKGLSDKRALTRVWDGGKAHKKRSFLRDPQWIMIIILSIGYIILFALTLTDLKK
jgi:hypothetical protein